MIKAVKDFLDEIRGQTILSDRFKIKLEKLFMRAIAVQFERGRRVGKKEATHD